MSRCRWIGSTNSINTYSRRTSINNIGNRHVNCCIIRCLIRLLVFDTTKGGYIRFIFRMMLQFALICRSFLLQLLKLYTFLGCNLKGRILTIVLRLISTWLVGVKGWYLLVVSSLELALVISRREKWEHVGRSVLLLGSFWSCFKLSTCISVTIYCTAWV
jgi:hypothetical protein